MVRLILGVLSGLAFTLIAGHDPSTSSYIFGALAGVVIVSLVVYFAGDSLNLMIRLAVVFFITFWYHDFLELNSHNFFDSYKRVSFDEFLQSTWGLAWNQSIEDAKKDTAGIKRQRYMYEQYIANMSAREARRIAWLHSEEFSDLERSAAYANRSFSLATQKLGEHVSKALGITKWVNRPRSKWERIAFPEYSVSFFRLRIVGTLTVMSVLAALLLAQNIIRSPKHENRYTTVCESLFTFDGWYRINFLIIAFIFGVLMSLLCLFLSGPAPYLFPYLYSPLFGLLVWMVLLINRD
jgi:hypothetical protein